MIIESLPTRFAVALKHDGSTGHNMGNVIRVVLAVFIIIGGQMLADKPELYESFFDAIYELSLIHI